VEHLELTREEFTRQADRFAASTAVNDEELARRFADAAGTDGKGRVLDVACGPGITTAALARNAREIVAFDLTTHMLDRARQRCAKAGLTNVTFQEGDATALPFPDGHFDAVATLLSIHHFTEPRRVVAEMFRVLKRGGTCVIADCISVEDAEQSALHNALEIWRDPSHVRMLPRSELVSLIESVGFAVTAQNSWDTPRRMEEWFNIVSDAQRVVPLRRVMRALARAGDPAGMDLSPIGDDVGFVHRWHMIVARKPE